LIVNTNISATVASRTFRESAKALSDSVARLSSGSKITSPEDDAAGLAQAIKLGSESKRNKAVVSNLTNAISYSQTQDGLLEKVQKSLVRMGELTILASDISKTDIDRSNYQQEFAELQSYIIGINDTNFNGISLFGSSSHNVINDAKGGSLSLAGINLSTPVDRVKLLEIDTQEKLSSGQGNYEVTTLAGSGSAGSANGTGVNATFNYPTDVVVDDSGNVFVADRSNGKVRKITPEGVVTDFSTGLSNPEGLGIDSSGNLYLAQESGRVISKITSDGVISTIAGSGTSGSSDGNGLAAEFVQPQDAVVDSNGNIYVANTDHAGGNHTIRKITPAGDVSTLGGTNLSYPMRIAIDSSDNLYITENFGSRVVKISAEGVQSNFATGLGGIGSATGIAVDIDDNIYISGRTDNLIRKITPEGVVTTIAGSGATGTDDGEGTSASFHYPRGIDVDSSGNLFVADSSGNKIRKISAPTNPLESIKTAIQEIANLRAQAGGNISTLKNEIAGVNIYDENLTSAISRIKDVDVAEESTRFARSSILVQSGTAMLSQANNLPEMILKLVG